MENPEKYEKPYIGVYACKRRKKAVSISNIFERPTLRLNSDSLKIYGLRMKLILDYDRIDIYIFSLHYQNKVPLRQLTITC